jgi:NAD(P)-dependent dehydrogenase (short-subunit alcohol dehydrogenase family)
MRPLVLITGTSGGIGLAAAVACAQAGFEVIATMRDLGRRAELDMRLRDTGLTTPDVGAPRGVASVHVEQLDVTSRSAADKVHELLLKYGPIENLVNSAALAIEGAFEDQSDRDVRDQLETNFFGALAVTRGLLPTMRAQRRGRIINVSGIVGHVGLPALGPYAASKQALEGLSEALRFEVAPFGIAVCMVESGRMVAPIGEQNLRRAQHFDPGGAYGALCERLGRMYRDLGRVAPSADMVAAKIAGLLASESPPFRSVVGNRTRVLGAVQRVLPDRLLARAFQRWIRPG